MAHGFGGTRAARLDAFAERFADAGLAALVFDYRHFGDSGGEPRQLLDIGKQHDDWRAALAFARTAPRGRHRAHRRVGHVLLRRPRDGHRRRGPRASPRPSRRAPSPTASRRWPASAWATSLKLTVHGIRDQVGALLGRPPHLHPDRRRARHGGDDEHAGRQAGLPQARRRHLAQRGRGARRPARRPLPARAQGREIRAPGWSRRRPDAICPPKPLVAAATSARRSASCATTTAATSTSTSTRSSSATSPSRSSS